MAAYHGACRCGAVGFDYQTRLNPSLWSVRLCQCSFCRAHGARCTSDPQGQVSFWTQRGDALARYRFGLRTADFLLCRICGTYIGAVFTADDGRSFANVTVDAVRPAPVGVPAGQPVNYDTESEAERRARRARNWTPVVTVDDAAPGASKPAANQ